MDDGEYEDNSGVGLIFGFFVWLFFLFTAYWWVAVLWVGVPAVLASAIGGWNAYKNSETYRYRRAQREIDELTWWAKQQIWRLGERRDKED